MYVKSLLWHYASRIRRYVYKFVVIVNKIYARRHIRSVEDKYECEMDAFRWDSIVQMELISEI